MYEVEGASRSGSDGGCDHVGSLSNFIACGPHVWGASLNLHLKDKKSEMNCVTITPFPCGYG